MDRLKVKEDYLDSSLSVDDVCARHGIDPSVMYRALDAQKVPRRESPEFDLYVLSEAGKKSA